MPDRNRGQLLASRRRNFCKRFSVPFVYAVSGSHDDIWNIGVGVITNSVSVS